MTYISPSTTGRGTRAGDPFGFVHPESFGATGGNSAHDDADAIQAALNASATTGRAVWLHPSRTYYLTKRLDFDPSRMMMYGNAATLNWSTRTFIDPASYPELVTNYSFDDGGTGWTTGISHNNTGLNYTGGAAVAPATAVAPNGSKFAEFGRQVTGMVAGKTYRVTFIVNSITTLTSGFNTFHDITVSFRPNGVGNGSSGGTLQIASGTSLEYQSSKTWTWDITSPYNDPYLTIGSNAGFSIASVSVKEAADNSLMRVQVPPEGTARGHVERGIDRVNFVGDVNHTDWVDAMLFDTLVSGYASRMNITNCNINVGIGRGMVFHNRAYLLNLTGTRVATTVCCFETVSGADTGENLVIIGGNSGGGKCGVRNTGGFGLRFFSHSCDFVRQWYVGRGVAEFYTPWWETRQFTSTDAAEADFAECQYRIDVQTGEVKIFGGYLQIDGNPDVNTYPTHMFRVGKNARLTLRDVDAYNWVGSSGEWATGEGRVDCTGLRGGAYKATPPVIHASEMHNAFGAGGGAESGTVDINASLVAAGLTGAVQTSRHQIDVYNQATTTTTATRGSNVVTMTSTTGRAAGDSVTHAGFPTGTVVVSVDSGTQLTLSQNYNGATGSTSVIYRGATPTGTAKLESTTEAARTGTHSYKISRTFGPSKATLLSIFWPCAPRRPIGSRFYWKVPGGGSGSVQIYFQAWFVKLEDANTSSTVPRIVQSQFVTDLPKTVNLATGQDWTKLEYSTLRIDSFSSTDGYSPEWATHVQIYLNLFNVASGFVIYIDDLHGNSM